MLNKVNSVRDYIRREGVISGTKISATKAIEDILSITGEKINYGEDPFGEDWDILVLLDGCRFDLFTEFASNHPIYDRFSEVNSRFSCASSSPEWINKVYGSGPNHVLSDIHLVSANGWEEKEIDLGIFGEVTPVWRHNPDAAPTITPDIVTDAAIHSYHNTNYSQMIVHYMQPHAPFLGVPGKYNSINEYPGQGKSQNVWEGLRSGKFDIDEVWQDYGENLLIALDEVDRLINNVEGDVVISADHANSIGELGVYGHPKYSIAPSVKRVPWVKLDAVNKCTSRPEKPVLEDNNSRDIESHLKNLGYKV